MAVTTDEGTERRFGEFLGERIGRHLRRREQRESFALYAHGIVADGERKSVEPIAARATGAGDDDDVGVQRQYTGTLGKIGNCRIGVSLTVATSLTWSLKATATCITQPPSSRCR